MAQFATLFVECANGPTWLEVGEVARWLPSLQPRLQVRARLYTLSLPEARREIVELLGRHIHYLVECFGYQPDMALDTALGGDISLDIPREDLLEVFRLLQTLQERSLAEIIFYSELERALHYDLLLEVGRWEFYQDFSERLRQAGLKALEKVPLRLSQGREPAVFPRKFYRFLWPSLLDLPSGEQKQSLQLSFLVSLRQAKFLPSKYQQVSTEDLPIIVAEALAEPLPGGASDCQLQP